jgi:hypothetical protein
MAGIVLSLLFQSLQGNDFPQAGTLSQRKIAHGWPAIWLYRTWQPYFSQDQPLTCMSHPSWPWAMLPGEQVHFVGSAIICDVLTAAVIFAGAIIGISSLGRIAPKWADTATVGVLCCLLTLLLLFSSTVMAAITVFVNFLIWIAIVLAGYGISAQFVRLFHLGSSRMGQQREKGDGARSK